MLFRSDIGSGSTSLAVFEGAEGGFVDRVHQEGEALRLIEKIDARGRLPANAVRTLSSCIRSFVATAARMGATPVHIVATSAMRDAVNGAEIVRNLDALDGVDARLISGEEEGRLAAHAVLCTLPLRDGIVLDLGGGSLQLTRVMDRRVTDAVSLPLGALRLYDAFLLGTDPPSAEGLVRLRQHVVAHLRGVPWLAGHAGELVAVGGSARSFGKIRRRAAESPFGHGHGFTLDAEALLDSYERLSRMPSGARAAVPGVPDHRADTIVSAALILSTVVRMGGFTRMHLSTYGIREGVAFRALYGPDPIPDPAGAGIRGRLGRTARPGAPVQRLLAAAKGHPVDDLLARPIQGFWQDEIQTVVNELRPH